MLCAEFTLRSESMRTGSWKLPSGSRISTYGCAFRSTVRQTIDAVGQLARTGRACSWVRTGTVPRRRRVERAVLDVVEPPARRRSAGPTRRARRSAAADRPSPRAGARAGASGVTFCVAAAAARCGGPGGSRWPPSARSARPPRPRRRSRSPYAGDGSSAPSAARRPAPARSRAWRRSGRAAHGPGRWSGRRRSSVLLGSAGVEALRACGSRSAASARLVWDFTVPTEIPRAAAVSASLSSS